MDVTLALGSLNPAAAAAEEKISSEKSAEKVQEKRQISGQTKVPTHPKLTQDFTPLIYGSAVTPGLGQYAIPEDPAQYAARKLPNTANTNYLKLAQTQGQLSPSQAPQHYQQPVFVPQAPRVNTISDAEYLQLIQNAQKFQAAAPPQAQHFVPFVPQHQAALLVNPAQRQYAQLYPKQTSHPLADSSLEREIEKLVAANSPQQTASSQRQSTKVPKQRQFLPKNQHNFVFIPYQAHALQQFVPAVPQATLKQQQAVQPLQFHQFLPQAHFVPLVPHQAHHQQEIPLASPLVQYHKAPQTPQAHNTQFPTTKPAELKQVPQQQSSKAEASQKAPAHSTIYVSHSTSTPPFASPTKQSHYTAKPASHSQESSSQAQHTTQSAGHMSVNALAASIFKTPPSQQRPLTQEEFQSLVDAGYPVTPIHVPVPVPISAKDYDQSHQQHQQHQQQPQQLQPQQQFKYSPQTAGSQYQPAILSPATYYAPQPQGYYHREQRDTAKETQP
ncbi:ataxin-2 homolog [Phlebotomus argentipes]|uniref:ataxin-2 homolog n=1 Tax=Phlebotomus argentipes TaxID=94469 RepID=UPI002892FA99|nr:ataxin-2 homolog [Phlebotomus argentipes]